MSESGGQAMFDVLIYLFETYIYNEAEMSVDQDRLTDDLTQVGFQREDINNALSWLEKLADLQEGETPSYLLDADPSALRIYTREEVNRLDVSCRGFLLFLEQIKVLNFETREMVIDRIMALDTDEFELEDLKWVVLMVLFNVPGYENAYQQMEELLFEVGEGYLH
jgi:Smg protein